MAENCNHDCSTCGENCASRTAANKSFVEEANNKTKVRKMIAVVSGKGGVGKSLTTALLAVAAGRAGKKAGILDADITGPSIPHLFGIHDKAYGDGEFMFPVWSDKGCAVMSTNLILDNTDDPVVWRGALIASAVKQFWTDVAWGELDYLFIDMPPGTGDVPLTVFQSLPIDGIVIVTSPQDLVSMVVGKALKMAEKMSVPVLGIVENMSYITCPDCGRKIRLFGEGHIRETAEAHRIPHAAELPIRQDVAALCDSGRVEDLPDEFVMALSDMLASF